MSALRQDDELVAPASRLGWAQGAPGAPVRADKTGPSLIFPVLEQIIANHAVSGRILPAISYYPVQNRSRDFETYRSLDK